MRDAMEHMNMSARAYDRILKVARTIADLEGTMGFFKNIRNTCLSALRTGLFFTDTNRFICTGSV